MICRGLGFGETGTAIAEFELRIGMPGNRGEAISNVELRNANWEALGKRDGTAEEQRCVGARVPSGETGKRRSEETEPTISNFGPRRELGRTIANLTTKKSRHFEFRIPTLTNSRTESLKSLKRLESVRRYGSSTVRLFDGEGCADLRCPVLGVSDGQRSAVACEAARAFGGSTICRGRNRRRRIAWATAIAERGPSRQN
jgi:hypothetical protein